MFLIKKHQGQGERLFNTGNGCQVVLTWTKSHLVQFISPSYQLFFSASQKWNSKTKKKEKKNPSLLKTKVHLSYFCNGVKTTKKQWVFLDNVCAGSECIQCIWEKSSLIAYTQNEPNMGRTLCRSLLQCPKPGQQQ